MIPGQFEKLTELLRGQLGAIEKALHERNTTAHGAQETANRGRRDIPRITASLIYPSEERQDNVADREETHGEQRQLISSQNRTADWTRNVCIAVILYGVIAAIQGCLMWRTYTEIQTQTALLQQQFENTNAASVTVQTPFSLSNYGQIDFLVADTGRNVATDIGLNAVVTLKAFPSDETIKVFPTSTMQIPRLEPEIPNIDMSLQRNHFTEWNIVYPLSDSEKSQLEKGQVAVTASLSYSFNNGFRKIDDIDAGCFGYFNRPVLAEVRMPDGQIQGSGHTEGTYPCEVLRKNMVDAVEWEAKIRNRRPPGYQEKHR